MDEHFEVNRRRWDELAAVHPEVDSYDLEGFLSGQSTLTWLEREGVGDVDGVNLLHLQSHFGLDTLSWLREGARSVVGVDFSPVAVETARDLAAEAELANRARFIEANVTDLPANLDEAFDVVFTSFGVLNWLPDLGRWAAVVSRSLRAGGRFFIAELHPISHVIGAMEDDGGVMRSPWPYFSDAVQRVDEDGSYADPTVSVKHTATREWSHDLGTIVTSLLDEGLRIQFLRKHPFASFEHYPGVMRQRDDGFWDIPGEDYPLTFSLGATKPRGGSSG